MSLELVTAPAVEPLSLVEARDHIRASECTDGIEDAAIEGLIAAAREVLDGRDGYLGRQMITATWDLFLDEFPVVDFIRLPLPPIQSITSISYVDVDGNTQTFDASNYALSADKTWRPRVDLAYNSSWPGTRDIRDAVTIRFVAGYGLQAAVPAPLRQAMLLLIGNWYENREHTVIGTIVSELPMGVNALLSPYRVIELS